MFKLWHGDCLDLMKDIPDGSIDAVICDPPYGTTICKWDSVIDLDAMWQQLERVIKDNGVIALFAQTPFDKVLGASNLKLLRHEWIYEKTMATGGMNAKKMPLKAHENILIFYKRLPTYNPQFEKGKPYKVTRYKASIKGVYEDNGLNEVFESVNTGKRYPRSVIKFSNPNNNSFHPTQKPVDLMEYLVKTYTNENDLVLDFTMGSGSTGVACAKTNRGFIGIELDRDYYDIAVSRINEAKEAVNGDISQE